ncbi:MAG: hypothetical protein C0523_00805 [Cytophaga sp.]|nr:hypothetical protein [Cytophaga sp.]
MNGQIGSQKIFFSMQIAALQRIRGSNFSAHVFAAIAKWLINIPVIRERLQNLAGCLHVFHPWLLLHCMKEKRTF